MRWGWHLGRIFDRNPACPAGPGMVRLDSRDRLLIFRYLHKNPSRLRRPVTLSKLALIDEKDLSTAQSPTKTDARISRPDGDARRTRRAQTASQQRPQTADDHHSAQTARLAQQPADESFSAEDRIRRRAEFLSLQRRGIRAQSVHFVVYAMRDEQPGRTRLGITVSRRVGGAVVRNRIKRRVRECFRRILRATVPVGTAMIVIARSGAGAIDSATMLDELRSATLAIGQKL